MVIMILMRAKEGLLKWFEQMKGLSEEKLMKRVCVRNEGSKGKG